MPEVRVGGIRLYYEQVGAGPTVLLLHGIGSNRRSFRHQTAELRDAFTLVAMDARGYGRSEDSPGPFTLDDLADDAAGLLDHLGAAGPVHVLGHSLGGVVAQLLYLRHPRRVASLILADTNPGSGSLPEPERSRRVQSRLEAIAHQTPHQIAVARAPSLVTPGAPPELVAELIEVMAEIRPAGYSAAAVAMGTTDLRERLPEIRVPCLLVCGEQDLVTPPETSAAMARAIPGAQLAIIPNAGHASNQEQPERFNHIVRGFLKRVALGKPSESASATARPTTQEEGERTWTSA